MRGRGVDVSKTLFYIMKQEDWTTQDVSPLEMSNMKPVQPWQMQRWKSPMTP